MYVYIVSIKSFISFYIAKMQDQTSSWMRYLWHRMWLKHKASHKDMWTDLIRCLSTWQLTLLGVGNTIGVGIYVLLGVMVKEEAGRAVCNFFQWEGNFEPVRYRERAGKNGRGKNFSGKPFSLVLSLNMYIAMVSCAQFMLLKTLLFVRFVLRSSSTELKMKGIV